MVIPQTGLCILRCMKCLVLATEKTLQDTDIYDISVLYLVCVDPAGNMQPTVFESLLNPIKTIAKMYFWNRLLPPLKRTDPSSSRIENDFTKAPTPPSPK